MGDRTTVEGQASSNGAGEFEEATASEEESSVGFGDAVSGIAAGMTSRLTGAGKTVAAILRRYGTVDASHQHAQQALRKGAALLVYPGGDWEVHRPTWEGRKVDFDGRRGFIRLALNEGVPIVPVVSAGGQETALFLSRGDWLARLLQLDRLFRLKVLPILLAPPWGIS